jgi:hypothetical protein
MKQTVKPAMAEAEISTQRIDFIGSSGSRVGKFEAET